MEEDCSICPVSITLFFLCSLIFGICILQVNCKCHQMTFNSKLQINPKTICQTPFFFQDIKKKKKNSILKCLYVYRVFVSICEYTSESVLSELNSTSIKERKLFAIRNFYFNIRTPRMKSFN